MALTQIKTDAISDDAVTLAKQAAGTDGQIITYDASGNPTAVGPGTDGQVLTSTGAGSPPAFEDAVSEGTQVKSTGESGGTKFLREDGDGTCSWQTVSAGTALTGSTDNTLTTVTGANAIQGEANLKFDGDHVTQTIDASGEGINQTAAGNHYIDNFASSNRTSANGVIWRQTADWNGKTVAQIKLSAGTDTTNKDDGEITFWTSAADNNDEKMKIGSDGHVTIKDGDLVIGTAGHGIDFSTASDSATGETVSSSVFDDYEEGTFASSIVSSNVTLDDSSVTGHYVKIGRIVHACGVFSLNTNDGSPAVSGSDSITQALPFQPRSTNAAMTGTIFQQNINAGPGTSVGHPHYYNPFPVDYVCYPASDGIRFYINKIEYAYERMTNSHLSAGFPGYTWMAWSITYQTNV